MEKIELYFFLSGSAILLTADNASEAFAFITRNHKTVFRTLLNIYDRAFLQNELMAKKAKKEREEYKTISIIHV